MGIGLLIFFVTLIAIGFVTIYLIGKTFSRLYSSEGYFIFSIPTSNFFPILAKFLACILYEIYFTIIAVLGIVCVIGTYLSVSGIIEIAVELVDLLATFITPADISIFIINIIISILSSISIYIIAIGLSNIGIFRKNKVVFAIIFWFICFIVTSSIKSSLPSAPGLFVNYGNFYFISSGVTDGINGIGLLPLLFDLALIGGSVFLSSYIINNLLELE